MPNLGIMSRGSARSEGRYMGKPIGTGHGDCPGACPPAVVELYVSALGQRAAEDVDLAFRFLKLAGVIPAEHIRLQRPCPAVSLDLMLKAAALMRLLHWQQLPGGTVNSAGLPETQELLDDMHKL